MPTEPSAIRIERALADLDTIAEACSCRNVKQRGCQNGECECNKGAFPRGGILLAVPCQRRLHQAIAAVAGAIQEERV